jgi:uncharacterized protein (DUF1800 family)
MEKALVADASIALNRFGYGARPGDAVPDDPKRWLTAQFDHYDARPPAVAAAPGRRQVATELAQYLAGRQADGTAFTKKPPRPAAVSGATDEAMTDSTPPMMAASPQPTMKAAASRPGKRPTAEEMAAMTPAERQGAQRDEELRRASRMVGRDNYMALAGARVQTAVTSDTPFVERLVQFWSNHFAVSADKLEMIGFVGTLEMEAIRPHVLGRFGDMLNAVERHPAMLVYLDQAQSIGPDSMIGARVAARGKRKIGLNENLGREIMELHTLGVRSGYTQADVTEFSRALTGWTISGITKGPGARLAGTADGPPGEFMFAAELHEPGARTIMGKTYAEAGEAQAQAVLDDLAASPATATHIATKLARHFTGDTPPPPLVDRLRTAYLQSHGDLPTVYRALIDSPEAWVPQSGKFKSPWDWSVSAYRAIGAREVQPVTFVALVNQLGQPMWKPGSPAGYDDVMATWAGPDAVMRRVEAASRFGDRAGSLLDARALAPKLFPAAVTPPTSQALARAESPGQALALLLVSPEFMRR